MRVATYLEPVKGRETATRARRRFFYAVIVLLAALLCCGVPAARAEILVSTLPLNFKTVTATAELNAIGGVFCFPCTVTNTVSINTTVDSGRITFSWEDASGGTLMRGTLSSGSSLDGGFPGAVSRSNVYTTYESLLARTGRLRVEETYPDLTDVSVGQASYFQGGTPGLDAINAALDIVGKVVEIRSELKGSPTKAELVSRVERIGPAEYAYIHTVNNLTDHELVLDWFAAGLTGTVAPQGALSSATFLGGAPIERAASATVTLTETLTYEDFDGESFRTISEDFTSDYLLRANVLTPLPLPASVWLFGAGCALLLGLGRLRRA